MLTDDEWRDMYEPFVLVGAAHIGVVSQTPSRQGKQQLFANMAPESNKLMLVYSLKSSSPTSSTVAVKGLIYFKGKKWWTSGFFARNDLNQVETCTCWLSLSLLWFGLFLLLLFPVLFCKFPLHMSCFTSSLCHLPPFYPVHLYLYIITCYN